MHFSPATVIASLALVLAMSGGAYAAGKYVITSAKQISPKVLKSLKGANGKDGAAGPAGAQGPVGPAGPQGAKGENGANGQEGKTGKEGSAGKDGPTGPTGPSGETGFTSFLPLGKTETGDWVINTEQIAITTTVSGGAAETSISFPIPLPEASEHVYFFSEEQTMAKEFGSSGCSGTVEAPEAPPGTLCVYTSHAAEFFPTIAYTSIYAADSGPFDGADTDGRTGAVMSFRAFPSGQEGTAKFEDHGTWAVTAPAP